VTRVARVVYPISIVGLSLAAVLNAVTWLPIDVSSMTPVWVALFVCIFPIYLPVVLIWRGEQKAYRESSTPRLWSLFRPRLPWRDFFVGVPAWILLVGGLIVVYVGANFFVSMGLLPGQPQNVDGHYYFDQHGLRIPTDRSGYLAGLRYQMRLFTGHPMIFYGLAALTMYGRRGGSPLPTSSAGGPEERQGSW
jgi:hypothetical protein